MKRLTILLVVILILTGCSKKENIIINEYVNKEEPIEEIEDTYTDSNNTIIGLYFDKGSRLELIKEYKTNIISGVDVGVFQIYPSNDDEVILNSSFGTSFYNAWVSLPNYNNLKIGFNVKYTLDTGEEISYNILDYKVIYKELYNYLYDDYANRYNSWYSHIKEDDYNEDTLFTSIKLFGAEVDTLDDFDDGQYRGNSSYTITICDIEKTCN